MTGCVFRIVNGRTSIPHEPELGVVEEGTRCGSGMMCLNRTCQSLSVLNTLPCPTGEGQNDTVCSDRGVSFLSA